MAGGTNAVNVEHSMSTDGFLIPIKDLECKRTITSGSITKEEYYIRGKIYANFYTWSGTSIVNNFNDDYVKPAIPDEWNIPGVKPKNDPTYPFKEFYPWQALKLIAYNVRYSNWRDGSYTPGNNEWIV